MSAEIPRKAFHLAYGLALGAMALVLPPVVSAACLGLLIVTGGMLSKHHRALPALRPFLKTFERRGTPAGKGALAFTMGAFLAAALAASGIFTRSEAAWGIFFLAIGDSAATVVGKSWGRHVMAGTDGGKTWEGFLAGLGSNALAGLAFAPFGRTAILLTATLAAAVEILPERLTINDNLWIPAVSAAGFAVLRHVL